MLQLPRGPGTSHIWHSLSSKGEAHPMQLKKALGSCTWEAQPSQWLSGLPSSCCILYIPWSLMWVDLSVLSISNLIDTFSDIWSMIIEQDYIYSWWKRCIVLICLLEKDLQIFLTLYTPNWKEKKNAYSYYETAAGVIMTNVPPCPFVAFLIFEDLNEYPFL